jgi:hypothetical protein
MVHDSGAIPVRDQLSGKRRAPGYSYRRRLPHGLNGVAADLRQNGLQEARKIDGYALGQSCRFDFSSVDTRKTIRVYVLDAATWRRASGGAHGRTSESAGSLGAVFSSSSLPWIAMAGGVRCPAFWSVFIRNRIANIETVMRTFLLWVNRP